MEKERTSRNLAMISKKHADVVVIGGGVIGTAVSYFLVKKGIDVLLLEKKGIASGTSGKCEGDVLVCDKMSDFDIKLTKLSQDLFPQLAGELDYDIGWSRKGSLLVIENEKEMKAAEDLCARLKAEGLAVRILDHYAVHADEPYLASDVLGGMETVCDGSLNPMALAQGLSHGTEKWGGTILAHTTVENIRLDQKGQIDCVATERGSIYTRKIVNAAGVWAPQIGRMVGVELPIQPRQGQLLVAERTPAVARRKVMEFGYMMAKFGSGNYTRNVTPEMEKYGVALVLEPTEAHNFLIGSSRRFVGTDTSCDLEVLQAIAQRAIRFFPRIKDVRIIRSYAGLRPYTPDHLPIISETDIPGFYIAAGHEGDGIGLSLITGKLIAQMICGESPAINMEPLKLSRFDKSNDRNGG